MQDFVHQVVNAIGITGGPRNKLGFAIGPLCFGRSDDETRQFIRDALPSRGKTTWQFRYISVIR